MILVAAVFAESRMCRSACTADRWGWYLRGPWSRKDFIISGLLGLCVHCRLSSCSEGELAIHLWIGSEGSDCEPPKYEASWMLLVITWILC